MPRLKNKNFIHTLVKQGAGYEIILWLNHRTDHEPSLRGSKRTGCQLYHYQYQLAFLLPCGALSLDCLRFCCKSLEMWPRPPALGKRTAWHPRSLWISGQLSTGWPRTGASLDPRCRATSERSHLILDSLTVKHFT